MKIILGQLDLLFHRTEVKDISHLLGIMNIVVGIEEQLITRNRRMN